VGRSYDTVSFLSDYGTADEFVGVVHSVIRSIAPHAAVVDITHGVDPHDVRGGSLALVRACQYMVPGVALAVVDPGVGTERRAVAVEVGDGESILVGPDNGLLAPAVAMVGGAGRCVSLTDSKYHVESPGATFAGRDILGPAAAHLCNGVDLFDLGEEVDPITLLPGVVPLSQEDTNLGGIRAEILWVDRYGNCQLNVDPEEVAAFGSRVQLRWGDDVRTADRAHTYQRITPGQVGLVTDSYGMLSVCMGRRSAADELSMPVGTEVTLAAPTDDQPAVSTPVAFTTTRSTTP